MERSIIFNNYKTLGIKEMEEKLIINTSLNKENIGELIILVGPNNSGKSNILKGINAISNNICINDKPNFIYENVKPKVSLVVKDGDDIFEYIKTINKSYDNFYDAKEFAKKSLSIESFTLVNNLISELPSNHDLKGIFKEIYDGEFITEDNYEKIKQFLANDQKYSLLANELDNIVLKEKDVNNRFFKKYGIKLIPTVQYYNSNDDYLQNDLSSDVYTITNKPFFKGLFSILGFDFGEIINCYETYNRLNNAGFLTTYERKINNRLQEVSADFNKIYKVNSPNYQFSVVLYPSQIHFNIYQSDIPLTLDDQSDGFKWFFNFFFKFASQNQFEAGDIILMDEPATNLHVYGQIELRKFIKQYAKMTGITFILSTHSPFLLDCDFLDEIRVIRKEDGITHIDNRFTVDIDEAQVDTLGPIVEALTVRRSIILNPENTVVLVEGITDYNYLTAFKLANNIDNVTFIPINGLKQENILDKLSKIMRKPILLVDSDNIAKGLQKQALESKAQIEIVCLNDIDPRFLFIESLFTESDKKKYSIHKGYGSSRDFKNNILTLELTKTTKDNFIKVINSII